MSLYNMINGVNPATAVLLAFAEVRMEEIPRFRDTFLKDPEHPEYDNKIHIYTRTGGGNREAYEEENNVLCSKDNFITDFDDSYDSTFASFVFEVKERWKQDFEKLLNEQSPSQDFLDFIQDFHNN